ncbi:MULTISPECIES: HAD family acid phosphatase [Streptomyces]|uniref:Hydrolase n=2 Tax=Streptomyces TaxID=1883 RepID=A0A100Y5S4_9ACTN|nr:MULTISPECIES: HAD family acid phosphatase [Streptomyces]KUH38176.1 hydrolase [Streptomyces kanasensis]UUS33539.1 hydrolase [Streptomyces changanensis]
MHAPGRARRWSAALAASAALTLALPAQATAAAAAEPAERRAAAVATHGGLAQLRGVDYTAWQRDVATALTSARPYLEQRTAGGSGQKLAIVLDIDNTSLETDFHYFWEYPTPAVRPVLDLARYAHSRGVAVFFVTARPGIIHDLTAHNLKAVGYPVTGLYVRDLPDLFEEVAAYKTEKRAEIEAKGYTVIANIGNRPSDLTGGHAERTFKLPDYDGKLS